MLRYSSSCSVRGAHSVFVALLCACLLGCGDSGVPTPDSDNASSTEHAPSGTEVSREAGPAAHGESDASAGSDMRPPSGHSASETADVAAANRAPPDEAETEPSSILTASAAPHSGPEAVTGPAQVVGGPIAPPSEEAGDNKSLDELLAAVEIPPAWLADVQTTYDTSNPWKDARLEIRRLLSLGAPATHREAIKLTWIYLQKDDIGDGHEYPMYTFLGGEPLWSIRAHQEYISKPHEHPPIHALIPLAKLYAQYGEFDEAESALETAMQGLPDPPWKIMREADLHAALGDLYAAWNRIDEAKRHYTRAAELYPTAKPPYGGHLLPRRAADVQGKLDLLTYRSLETASLRDGQYRDKALGYVGDIDLTVTIEGGKIADIQVRHEEKIDQNACVLIPQRIIDEQSLQVDGISGATVTKDAIVNGVYRCLKKAGLQ